MTSRVVCFLSFLGMVSGLFEGPLFILGATSGCFITNTLDRLLWFEADLVKWL